MKIIESENNKIIKLIGSLMLKKNRQEKELFVAEGEKLVWDGLKKAQPEFVLLSQSYKNKMNFPCETYQVSDKLFSKISDTKTPQGILGVFKMEKRNIQDISIGNTLILNKVSDPGNMGTLLRTAEAAGFSNVIIDSESVDLYNPKTIRSTMSALFHLKIYITQDLRKQITLLREKGLTVYATSLTNESVNLYEAKLKTPAAVMIGNEANGISKELLEVCDQSLIIPITGNMESLNAAIAGAIVMYEIVRREYYD